MTSTSLATLFDRLRAEGIELWAHEGRLRYRANGAISPETRDSLIEHKAALVAALTAEQPERGGLAGAGRPAALPLSFGQESMWYLDRLGLSGFAYNVTKTFRLEGELDVAALRRAFAELVRRHEILRTRYTVVDGTVAQQVMPAGPVRWDFADLSNAVPAQAEREGEARVCAHAATGFDLATENAFAVQLLRLAPQVHLLNVTVHHILMDASSFDILTCELDVLYRAYTAGEESPLPDLPVQYADFALWQRRRMDGPDAAADLAYWRERLGRTQGTLDLPIDGVRPPVFDHAGRVHTVALPAALSDSLAALARDNHTTRFTVLLAAFVALLSRWSGQTDLTVGVPVDSRGHVEAEGLVGYFLNPTVLRAELHERLSFLGLVRQVRERLIEAYDHRDLPFDVLVADLAPARDLSRHPLFQVAFTTGDREGPQPRLGELVVREVEIADNSSAKFDITMFAGEGPDGVTCSFEYATSLFDADTIDRLAGHLVTLLKDAVADPNRPVATVALLTDGERASLEAWNATDSPYRSDRCLHELVEEQVRRTPDAVAVICGARSVTYDELNRQANRWAWRLRELGVGPDRIVGVCLDRSIDMVVALLAVLKAGGAYLPLDPAYPRQRLAYMLGDSEAAVVLTKADLADRLGDGHAATVLCLDTDATATGSWPDTDPDPSARPNNLVWCLYTSGSTGRPKGVLVEHRSAVAFLHWSTSAFGRGDLERVLLSSSLNYDPSAFELYTPLAVGGSVVVVDDALALCAPSAALEPTLVSTVPSAARALAEADAFPGGTRLVTLSGEAVSRQTVDAVRARLPQARIYDIYGPTETTIVVTAGEVAPDGPVTIGRPLTNTQIHLLDVRLAPVPVGVPGELFVAGDGLARGYRNAPALTATRFLPNPFGPPGSRMYATGDLARRLAAGTITFLGRLDDQVKVRGFRIELGEVENALARCAEVAEVAVTAHESASGDRRLVAYVVGRDGPVDVEVLRDAARRTLPEHMVPSWFVALDRLPTTASGKTDRAALPEPAIGEDGVAAAEPVPARTATEKALAALWQEVLGVETVGVEDDFFRRGGYSLLTVRLVVRAREVTGVAVSLADFLAAPTVAAMSRMVDAVGPVTAADPVPGPDGSDPFLVLLPINTGPGRPLFCIHPIIGLSWCYLGLAAQLPPDVPVYGLQVRGLTGPEPLPDSIEDMAADYVAQLRTVQPAGPYRLLGWSLGGCVAHAMATQLQTEGEQVSLLAMVDCYFFGPDWTPQAGDDAGARDLMRLLPVDSLGGLDEDRLADIERISTRNVGLLTRFRPGVFRGDALFVASREDDDRPADVQPEMWTAHVTGHLDVHGTDHGHYDLMTPEPLDLIARLVCERLRQEEAADGA